MEINLLKMYSLLKMGIPIAMLVCRRVLTQWNVGIGVFAQLLRLADDTSMRFLSLLVVFDVNDILRIGSDSQLQWTISGPQRGYNKFKPNPVRFWSNEFAQNDGHLFHENGHSRVATIQGGGHWQRSAEVMGFFCRRYWLRLDISWAWRYFYHTPEG